MTSHFPSAPRLVAIAAATVILAACGEITPDNTNETRTNNQTVLPWETANGRLGGGDNGLLGLFGNGNKPADAPGANGIGVNTYLWRASLDTVSFMPLASADPFGGVIITEWYSPPETPNERFKLNLFILDRQLRANGIRVTVFRQTQSGDGRWTDAPVDGKTGTDFENTILTRARQLRVATAQQQQQQ